MVFQQFEHLWPQLETGKDNNNIQPAKCRVYTILKYEILHNPFFLFFFLDILSHGFQLWSRPVRLLLPI